MLPAFDAAGGNRLTARLTPAAAAEWLDAQLNHSAALDAWSPALRAMGHDDTVPMVAAVLATGGRPAATLAASWRRFVATEGAIAAAALGMWRDYARPWRG